MDTRVYMAIRKLFDRDDITEQEAVGVARYLLWLQMDWEY